MNLKDKVIIGLLSILVILGIVGLINMHGTVVTSGGATNYADVPTGYTGIGNYANGVGVLGTFWDNGMYMNTLTGTFTVGSTTLFSVKNPSSSTSTTEYVSIYDTVAATGTISISCGTSTSAYASPDATLVNAVSVATSTMWTIAAGQTAGAVSAGSGTFSAINVGPNEYVTCLATETYGHPITDTGSQFRGVYKTLWNY